jgi:hypothetical protein
VLQPSVLTHVLVEWLVVHLFVRPQLQVVAMKFHRGLSGWCGMASGYVVSSLIHLMGSDSRGLDCCCN